VGATLEPVQSARSGPAPAPAAPAAPRRGGALSGGTLGLGALLLLANTLVE